jgi:Ca-activated chloride channel family protein
MDHVVFSIARMLDLLEPTDQVGVVVFSEGAELVAEPAPLDANARRNLLANLRRIDPEGATDIEAGLRMSAQTLPPPGPDLRRAVLLLSDGAPTRGEPSADKLAAIAASFRPDLTVSTLGYGEEHHEDVLRKIADAGGGRYHYVREPSLCAFELARAVGAQGDAVAEAVELRIEAARGVRVTRVMGAPRAEVSEAGARVPLPDLVEGDMWPAVVELSLDEGASPGTMQLAHVTLAHRRPGAPEVLHEERTVSVEIAEGPAELDPAARSRVLLALADEARDEARTLGDQGNFDRAAALLRKLIGEIKAEPGAVLDDDSPLADAIAQLTDEAEVLALRPSPAQYRLFRKAQASVALSMRGAAPLASGPMSRRALASVAGALPRAKLSLVGEGGAPGGDFRLEGPSITVGRTGQSQVRVEGRGVAREHCTIVGQDGKFYVKDLGGGSSTLVNGKPLAGSIPLSPGDLLRVGEVELRYEEEGDKGGGGGTKGG